MRWILALLISFAPVIGHADGTDCSCTLQSISQVFTAIAKQAIPAVVHITSEGVEDEEIDSPFGSQTPDNPFQDDFFNRFFRFPQKKPPVRPASQGSGFFVRPDGYILTNAHVVKNAHSITVRIHDGREVPAKLIGQDVKTDIAVIKVEGTGYDFLELGDSDAMEVGQWVLAVGSPFQLSASVTFGHVSAKGRQNLRITDYEDFIQTDTAINQGNSGGPLLNLDGQVIGINTAIVSKTGGWIGIGFAIPSNMSRPIMNQIIDNGSVTHGYIGIALQPLDREMAEAFNLDLPEGALIADVVKHSPADKAGLQQGDIIIGYDDIQVKSIGTFRNQISMIKPGTKVILKVNRSGKILHIPVILGSHGDTSAGAGISQKLGMTVEPLTSEMASQLRYSPKEEGVVITKVKPGYPAALAGMRPGFLILAINHKKVTNIEEFQAALNETKKNRILILAKEQRGLTRFYSIKLP